jgi:predicted DCC family thiol-disulfide oxidoreductase YuxK
MDQAATHLRDHRDRTTASESAKSEGATIVYDGQCPFCSTYVRYTRLRDAVGPVKLVDARSGGPVVEEAIRAGFNLDEGMVLKYGGRLYHGADCLNMLSLLSSRSGLFNQMMAFAFARPGVAHMAYPALRAGRNATLKLLSRGQIHDVS